ncbi:hypothetical protein ACFQNF_16845 [Iodobacter arcticus]|uniref:Solute-binding protein family 3/N-terminal domain-containing protein n=1 Tax=Iodobacter arcticus TaxID=590593 RepID=A0ABW2R0S5_9NEIS
MREICLGLSKLGLFVLESNAYQIQPLPGVQKDPLYFAVGKKHPDAKQLIQTIDRGLLELMSNDKMAGIIQRYQQ